MVCENWLLLPTLSVPSVVTLAITHMLPTHGALILEGVMLPFPVILGEQGWEWGKLSVRMKLTLGATTADLFDWSLAAWYRREGPGSQSQEAWWNLTSATWDLLYNLEPITILYFSFFTCRMGMIAVIPNSQGCKMSAVLPIFSLLTPFHS